MNDLRHLQCLLLLIAALVVSSYSAAVESELGFTKIDHILSRLSIPLQEMVSFQVRMVGFEDTMLSPRDMDVFFNTIQNEEFSAVGPSWEWLRRDEDADDISSFRRKEARIMFPNRTVSMTTSIPVQKRLKFSTILADKALNRRIQAVIEEVVVKQGNQQVDFRLIDNIIAEHARTQSPQPGIVFYVIHLPLIKQRYQYGDFTSKYFSGCTFSMNVGSDTNHRYAWVDFGAGPVRYGPRTAGEGLITDMHIPFGLNYYSEPNKDSRFQILIDIVAFLRKTTKILIMPPLAQPLSQPLTDKIIVQLFVLHNMDEESRRPDTLSFLNTSIIETQLDDLARPIGADVEIRRKDISFLAHPFLSVAYFSATRIHTTGAMTRSNMHRYLDSRELRLWILRNKSRIIPVPNDNERIIPVFIFDFSNAEMLLLDKTHQAVSFPDMVFAIQSRAANINVDMSCNGIPVSINGNDITRALLGAIVQTGWAVSPTYRVWNSFIGNWEEDYTWAIGRTPFGMLSASTELSWAIKDAAARTQLYELLTLAKHTLITSLGTFYETYNTEVWAVLNPTEYAEFQRVLETSMKSIEMAIAEASLYHFQKALNISTKAAGLCQEVQAYLHVARTEMQSVLSCRKDEKAPTSFFIARYMRWLGPLSSIFIIGAVGVLYLWPWVYKNFVHKKKKVH